MTKKAETRIAVRLPADLDAKLQQRAAALELPASWIVRQALKAYLAGEIVPDPSNPRADRV